MSGKYLVLKLNAKMLLASQIAGFSNFDISKIIGGIKLTFCMQVKNYWRYKADFLHPGTYLLKLQIDDEIFGGYGQACPKRLLKL